MRLCPFSNALAGLARPKFSSQEPAVEIKLGILTRMLSMEMCRLVFFVEHTNDDTKECRNDGHVAVYSFGVGVRHGDRCEKLLASAAFVSMMGDTRH